MCFPDNAQEECTVSGMEKILVRRYKEYLFIQYHSDKKDIIVLIDDHNTTATHEFLLPFVKDNMTASCVCNEERQK